MIFFIMVVLTVDSSKCLVFVIQAGSYKTLSHVVFEAHLVRLHAFLHYYAN